VTVEEYSQWTEAATRLWWKALASVAYGSGLRRNEILNLTWSDIDFEDQLMYVNPKRESANTIEWEPKDHEIRVVPMPDETTQLLADVQAETQEGHSYIFISPERLKRIKQRKKEGEWTSRSEIINNMRENFHRIRCLARLTRFTLHDLRRSAITNWARRLPVQVVQQLAGHSDISTTREYYIAVEAEDIASANAVLNDILSCPRAN
jgi:integrase